MGIKLSFVLDEYLFYGFLFFMIGLVYSLTDGERIQRDSAYLWKIESSCLIVVDLSFCIEFIIFV
jgi:hypothetical protein